MFVPGGARTEKPGGTAALVYQRAEPPSPRGWRDYGVPGDNAFHQSAFSIIALVAHRG
jgi:hypothetical protein